MNKKTSIELSTGYVGPEHHYFKYRLRGGATGSVEITKQEKDRLFGLVQRNDSMGDDGVSFVVFDSLGQRVILNLDHLIFCHFLFEAFQGTDKSTEREESHEVSVILAGDPSPLQFIAAPDETDLSNETADYWAAQFQNICYFAQTAPDKNTMFSFLDVEGETAFFRGPDVAMMTIPLVLLDPELMDDEDGAISDGHVH